MMTAPTMATCMQAIDMVAFAHDERIDERSAWRASTRALQSPRPSRS
jgi:hypothetical protein